MGALGKPKSTVIGNTLATQREAIAGFPFLLCGWFSGRTERAPRSSLVVAALKSRCSVVTCPDASPSAARMGDHHILALSLLVSILAIIIPIVRDRVGLRITQLGTTIENSIFSVDRGLAWSYMIVVRIINAPEPRQSR
jgi:hypothetical protein